VRDHEGIGISDITWRRRKEVIPDSEAGTKKLLESFRSSEEKDVEVSPAITPSRHVCPRYMR
jgi:hypothetical protein